MKNAESQQLTPLVSVSLVTYNHAPYIAKAIDSILAQETDFPVEICIGEDHSSDGTREICQRYAEQYPDQIRLFLRERKDVIYIDGFPTGRFNWMETLKACQGKYIAVLEGDDYWCDPRKLQMQVDFLEANPEFNVCAHRTWIKTLPSEALECLNTQRGLDKIKRDYLTMWDYVMRPTPFHTSATVVRRLLDGPFPPLMKSAIVGDLPFTILHIRDKKIKVFDDYMSVRVKMESGLSSQGRFNPDYNLSRMRRTYWQFALYFRNRLSFIFLLRTAQYTWRLTRHRIGKVLRRWTPWIANRLRPTNSGN